MRDVGIMYMVVGLVIALTRAPLIFAPLKTREWYKRIFIEGRWAMRITGVAVLAVAVLMILAGGGHGETAAVILKWFGWLLAAVSVVIMIVFANVAKIVAGAVLDGMDELILRMVGGVAVVIGGAIVWFGLSLV